MGEAASAEKGRGSRRSARNESEPVIVSSSLSPLSFTGFVSRPHSSLSPAAISHISPEHKSFNGQSPGQDNSSSSPASMGSSYAEAVLSSRLPSLFRKKLSPSHTPHSDTEVLVDALTER